MALVASFPPSESDILKSRRNSLAWLNGFRSYAGSKYYVEEVQLPVSFREKVEQYFRKRAREELPEKQFLHETPNTDSNNLMEFNLLLRINFRNKLYELHAGDPSKTEVTWRQEGGELTLESLALRNEFNVKSYAFDKLIHMHSHPGKDFAVPSGSDISFFAMLQEQQVNITQKLYFSIYAPRYNIFAHYKITK
jgi:hypothetical protein